MCIKHLWPFCISRKQDKNRNHSCADSNGKRRSSVAPDGDSTGDSKENSATTQPTERSLIEGRWLQVAFTNFEAFYTALSVTNADLETNKILHKDTMVMTYRTLDSNGEVWEMVYESLQRGIIKNVMRLGEECDELTPHRQWVRSTITMPNKNTINNLRIYKNGTRSHIVMEVNPTNPDLLVAKLYVDDVETVITAIRIKS